MIGTIFIHELKQDINIGVYDSEKDKTQPVWIDLEIKTNFSPAIQAEDHSKAVDYDHVTALVRKTISKRHFNLLETLAYEIACDIYEEYPNIQSTKITIRKPAASEALNVGAVGVVFEHNY